MKLSGGVEWSLHCCVVLSQSEGAGNPQPDSPNFTGCRRHTWRSICERSRTPVWSIRPRAETAGTFLTRAPEKITVLDVVQAVDGTEPAFRCTEIRQQGILAAPPEQCRSACGIAKVMADAEKAWRASLSGVTIADLAATLDLPALRKILTTPITP